MKNNNEYMREYMRQYRTTSRAKREKLSERVATLEILVAELNTKLETASNNLYQMIREIRYGQN